MSTMLKPIPEILKQMLSQCQSIHDANHETMSTFELSIDNVERARAIENDIDRNSFLVKRLFCVASTQPGLAKEVGIDDLASIVHWETLNSNLERVGELEFESCLEMKRLLGKFAKEDISNRMYLKSLNYGFKQYHDSAQQMVLDAYAGAPEKITQIISTKKQDVDEDIAKHREGYISEKEGKAIRTLVNKTPELTCLDVRIWGLTGCSTNVAEAWLNMKGPSADIVG